MAPGNMLKWPVALSSTAKPMATRAYRMPRDSPEAVSWMKLFTGRLFHRQQGGRVGGVYRPEIGGDDAFVALDFLRRPQPDGFAEVQRQDAVGNPHDHGHIVL